MSVTEQAFSRRFPPRPSDPVHEVHDVHDVHEVHETTDPADPVQEPAEMADLLGVNATAYRKDLEKYKEVIGMSQSKRKEAIDWLKRAIQKNEGETRVLEKELGGKKKNKTTLLYRLGLWEGYPVHEVHDVHEETTDPVDPVQELAEMADLLGVDATALDTAAYRKALERFTEVIGMSESKRKEAIDWLKREIKKNEGETRVLEKELGGKKRKIQPNGDGIHGLQKQLAAKRQNKTTLLNRLGRLEGLEAAIRH